MSSNNYFDDQDENKLQKEYIENELKKNDGSIEEKLLENEIKCFQKVENGKLKVCLYFKNDLLHSPGDTPAVIKYYDSGRRAEEKWFQNGKLHREKKDNVDFPTWIRYYENGHIQDEYWHRNDELHHDNGLAHISYFEDGRKREQRWFQNGKYQRKASLFETILPSAIKFYNNGNVQEEIWYKNGNIFRDSCDGVELPAHNQYYENGKIKTRMWYVDGNIKRIEYF